VEKVWHVQLETSGSWIDDKEEDALKVLDISGPVVQPQATNANHHVTIDLLLELLPKHSTELDFTIGFPEIPQLEHKAIPS
jgi:hypothetical protein